MIHADSDTKAGGVAIYIKNNLLYNRRNDLIINASGCENIWIEIKQKQAKASLLA